MKDTLVCWKCGIELKGVILPMSRREVCAACGAEQHVCKLCRFYDPRVADMCREERAEGVRDKERANFCDYFAPKPGAWQAKGGTEKAVNQELAALFGDTAADTQTKSESALTELQKLFGEDKKEGG